jgi:hypothetical protein
VQAYEAWLRASVEVWKFSAAGVKRAIELVSHALETVGENALLRAALGYFHALAYDVGLAHDEETLDRAEAYATRALEVDPGVVQAHLALAWVRYKRVGVHAGMLLFRRAADLGSKDALWLLAFGLGEIGRIGDARRYADAAMAADPLNGMTGFARGMVEFWDGRYAEALGWFSGYLEKVAPDSLLIRWWRAQALAYEGRGSEALLDFERVAAEEAGVLSSLSALYCLAAAGDANRLQQALAADAGLIEAAKTDEWYPNFIAACLAMVGDYEGALDWLECAVAWGFSNHRFLGEYNPVLAPLRGHPRFERLLERAREKERAFGP